MTTDSNLLIFNFSMDVDDPLLSHQYEAACALAKNFQNVTIVTGRAGQMSPGSNMKIISTEWTPGDYIGNLLRLVLRSLPIIIRGDFKSVFYHMTDVQCALLSPLIWVRGRKQYLWYAHTFKSRYLVFSSWWVSKVITSTAGSCPLSGKKVLPIGQAIDEEKFSVLNFNDLNLDRLLHIGRFDKSKNIQLLISSARKLRRTYPNLGLTLIGSPANEESSEWAKGVVFDSDCDVREGWLRFKGSISRVDIPREMALGGCFFHGYIGSLDKTLVESTMLRVPVVTINPEYIEVFGLWSKSGMTTLESEYTSLRSMSQVDIERELDRRLSIAKSGHTLNHWVQQLTSLFMY